MGEKIEKQKYDPLVLAIISGTIRLMVLSGKSIEAFVQLGGRNTKISKRGIEGKKKIFHRKSNEISQRSRSLKYTQTLRIWNFREF